MDAGHLSKMLAPIYNLISIISQKTIIFVFKLYPCQHLQLFLQ